MISDYNEFCYDFLDDHNTTSLSENVTYFKEESKQYFSNNLDTKKKFEQLLTTALYIQLQNSKYMRDDDIFMVLKISLQSQT